MNGRFYSRNLQGQVFKQMYKKGLLVKEERELKFNNFFEILKLEHLDYKNIFGTIQLFKRDSQCNFETLSIFRNPTRSKTNKSQYFKIQNSNNIYIDEDKKHKTYSMNTLDLENTFQFKQKKKRKSSLILDKIFLEDQKDVYFGSPDNNTSSDNIDEMKNEQFVTPTQVRSISSGKKNLNNKESNVLLTVKRFFREDSNNKLINNKSDSFQEKLTTKRANLDDENNFDNKSKDEEFKSNFNYFESKFKEKVKNDKKSFFRNIFSKFLRPNPKDQKIISNNEENNLILQDDSEEDEDSDGLGDSAKPPNLESK